VARTFEELGIDLSRATQGPNGDYKTLCPRCSADRKPEHRREKCLSANPSKGVFHCFNCDWKGGIDDGRSDWREATRSYNPPVVITDTDIEADAITYFAGRGIGRDTLQRAGVVAAQGVIRFPYYLNGQHVNTKYRRLREKKMKMDAGARLTWWNIDQVRDARHIVIVEGEIDLLTLLEVGIDHVISLPNGAQTGAMSFFPDIDWDEVDRVTLAGDMDEPGEKCMQECAARIGKEKCWRVRWPEIDANKTLVEYGRQAVWDYFLLAQPIPIEGIEQPGDEEVRARVFAMYRDGLKPGLSTGYQHLDKGLTLVTNILDIWGGYPGSGKSELLDGIVVNAGVMHDWRTAMYSPENYPAEYHIEKLARKYVGKPFKEGKSDRMTEEELDDALDWLNEHVHFIRPEQPTVEEVLKLAKIEKRRFGIHWLTLDPWNTMIHSLGGGESVTDYIGRQLSTVRQFLRQHDLRVSICAHPRKPMAGSGKIVPGPYEAAGSHNFFAMADSMLAVGRHKNDISKPVEVHIQKVRHRHLGQEGVCTMWWKPATGRYEDIDFQTGGVEI
jgi:twinkle protein